jgi:hypothetical protein
MMDPYASPWFFFRDDLDVLEEDIDTVFLRHQNRHADVDTHAMEHEVLEEHAQSEPDPDSDGTMAIDSCVCPDCGQDHAAGWLDDPRPLSEILREGQWQDELYAKARRWADGLFAWSGRAYERLVCKDRDLFRLHVNVCLVPEKIARSREVEVAEDPLAFARADKELSLALIYLDRAMESLRRFVQRLPNPQRWQAYVVTGMELRRLLERRYTHLHRGQDFS